MDDSLRRCVNSVAGRAAFPLPTYDSITVNHHSSSNEPDDQAGPLVPSISTTQSASTVRTYHGNIARGRARAQYGDAHYHGGTHLHLHFPPNSNGYPSAAAYQNQYRNSSTLAIYDSQGFGAGSKPHKDRDMERSFYSNPMPAGNQQDVYDHSRYARSVHQNPLEFSTGQATRRWDNQLTLTQNHEVATDDQCEERHRSDLTYGCASCARRRRRCTRCET